MKKPKQQQKKIKLDTALIILDEVLVTYGYSAQRLPCWAKPPAIVIKELDAASNNGEITYNKASKIIDEARSSKMPVGDGINRIKELWRKNYLP